MNTANWEEWWNPSNCFWLLYGQRQARYSEGDGKETGCISEDATNNAQPSETVEFSPT